MAKLLRMPKVAANAVDAILANWLIDEGSKFMSGDALAVVETEKAAVDMAAESEGVLVRVLVENGATVEVGAPIALVSDLNENIVDIDGELTRLGIGTSQVSESAATSTTTVKSLISATIAPASDRIFSSPLARQLARNAGISLKEITGTGPNGRIRRCDVQSAITNGISPDIVRSATLARGSNTLSTNFDIPHTRMRKVIASRLVESKQTAPHFYVSGSCRVDALLSMRATLNEHSTIKISINDLVIKAIARAHTLVPEMNVIWTPEAIRQFSTVDISVAIATDSGLLTPVLRGADAMSITDIALATQDFVTRAKIGRIEPSELEGGAVSVTNLGMFGVEEFSAILNPPQSAILAVGAVKREAIVEEDTIKIGSVMRIVLSVDHRPVDGATAARWMGQFVKVMENPVLILA
jgi:pyruvate dehydrogenase E2 component (dihydrolipoamide acetyltransferase)